MLGYSLTSELATLTRPQKKKEIMSLSSFNKFVLVFLFCLCLRSIQAQSSKDIYTQIKTQPSPTRWCTTEAGDDPAGIISSRCNVFNNCLKAINLDEKVDHPPFPALSGEQIAIVKSCNQALYDAARSNPQIKGSKATQDWLTHEVLPSAAARPFSIPDSLGKPN
jgi:hypothetical protein